MLVDQYSNYTDMFFGNPMIKDIFATALDDTAEVAISGNSTDGSEESMMIANMVLQANSTEELFGMASQVPVDQVMEEAVPEDSIFGQIFSVFAEGLANSGLFRMGSREGSR